MRRRQCSNSTGTKPEKREREEEEEEEEDEELDRRKEKKERKIALTIQVHLFRDYYINKLNCININININKSIIIILKICKLLFIAVVLGVNSKRWS